MKNSLVCSNCQTENPFYGLICTNCKSYLRERINNIDFWNILARLIDSPVSAFRKIIQSEHKNFITFLVFFISLKLFIDCRFIFLAINKNEGNWNNVLFGFLIVLSLFIILIYIFGFLLKSVDSVFHLKTRTRDNASILIYSFVPNIFALFILFPFELIIFGGTVFSNNPSPFILKSTVAYTFTLLEGLCILWAIILNIIAMYAQSKNIGYSITTGLTFNALTWVMIYLLSSLLFL